MASREEGKKPSFGEDEEEEGLSEQEASEEEGGYTSDPEIGTAKRSYNFRDGSARRDRA